MQRTSFDFDVITGPVPPRPAPKPQVKPDAPKDEPRTEKRVENDRPIAPAKVTGQ
jgi:hypothetical protein